MGRALKLMSWQKQLTTGTTLIFISLDCTLLSFTCHSGTFSITDRCQHVNIPAEHLGTKSHQRYSKGGGVTEAAFQENHLSHHDTTWEHLAIKQNCGGTG